MTTQDNESWEYGYENEDTPEASAIYKQITTEELDEFIKRLDKETKDTQ